MEDGYKRLDAPNYTAAVLPAEGGFQMLGVQRLPTAPMLRSLEVPHCADGDAIATDFRNDRTPPPSLAANQSTEFRLCWDSFGMVSASAWRAAARHRDSGSTALLI